MRVLHIIPTLAKGGAERLVIDVVSELAKREDVIVKLVIFNNKIDYNISDISQLIEVIPSKIKLSFLRKNDAQIDELQNFINVFRPDIIHSHLYEAEIISRHCHFPEAKWFSHVHDNIAPFKPLVFKKFFSKSSLINYLERTLLFKYYDKNGGTHFVSISNETTNFIKSVQHRYKVSMLHNAIKFERFSKEPKVKEDSNFIELINIGSFVPKKNQILIPEIILELNKLGYTVSFSFLGQGPMLNAVKSNASQLGLQDQCHFYGNINEVEEYLWKSDMYIHTALDEPFGLVLLEAMAAGLPVISLDGGGNRDLLEEGKNGFMIDQPRAELFAEKILYLWKNPQIRKEMGEYASLFAKKYSIEDYCDKLLELYQGNQTCAE